MNRAMKKPRFLHFFALVPLATALVSCGGGGGGNSVASTTTFAANMHSATVAGISNQSATTVALNSSRASQTLLDRLLGINEAYATPSAGTVQPDIATGDFVSIDQAGNVARIFNYSFPIYAIKQTTNYLVVSGNFSTPFDAKGDPLIVDSSGKPLSCSLYAIKKNASGNSGDITCLSINRVGDYDPTLAATNAHYEHLGFATRGSSVYFTDFASGTLYKWSEGDANSTIIFQNAPPATGVGMDGVFLDPNSSNICVLYSAISTGTNYLYNGNVYCGNDSGLTNTITGTRTQPVLAESRRLGDFLLTGAEKIDLATLTVSASLSNGSNYGLPSGAGNVYTTASGATIQRAYAWSLSTTDASGNTCLLATFNGLTNTGCSITSQTIDSFFQTVLGLGNYTWTYGTSNPNDPTTGNYLAKINNSTITLDPANYLSATGLSSISDMSYASDGRIVITGKNSSGATAYAYIDSAGTITPSLTPPPLKLSAITSF